MPPHDADSDPGGGKSSRGGGGGAAGVDEYRCRLCNYAGRSQHCLAKHLRAHDLAYKICRYCRRAFERPSDLLRHEERHRRRDVLGASPTSAAAVGAGGGDPAVAETVATAAAAEAAVRQPDVGRVDSYVDGVVTSSVLVSAQLGRGDNDVVVGFDEAAADALVDQPAVPSPSKLRDVYSIMAGIFVNQHLLSLGAQTPPVAAATAEVPPQSAAAALVPPADFGQQAFLQMLDLKLVPDSTAAAAAAVAAPSTSLAAPAGCRERRRKGVPNRAAVAPDANDPSFADAAAADLLEAAKQLRAAAAAANLDDASPCNGVAAAGKLVKLGPEGGGDSSVLAGYSRDPGSCRPGSSRGPAAFARGRRSRTFFSISCKICASRLLQVCRHCTAKLLAT